MRTRLVTPITTVTFGEEALRDVARAARPDNQVDHVFIDRGPASIESEYDEALCVPATLAAIVEAQEGGIDAVVINCMADPGLKPARELADIPVIGAFDASGHLAATLGRKFSVLTVLEGGVPMFWDRAHVYGLTEKMASVRAVGIPVLELEEDRGGMVRALVKEGVRAVQEDGADVLVFGCTGMAGVARQVAEGVAAHGYAVPVVDPSVAAVKVAESLVDMGLSHSRRGYFQPPHKKITGYPDLLGRLLKREGL